MKKTRLLIASIMAGVVMASTALAANYYQNTGASIVSVQSCQQIGKDIRVTQNNQIYTLTSACRDAGYGLRDYTLTCSGAKNYLVTWKSCTAAPTPAPTPKPVPTPASTPLPTPTVNTKPIITLNGGTKTMFVGDNYIAPTVSATDAEDGNITFKIKVSGTINTQAAGTYTQTFTVVDSKNLAADPKIHTVSVAVKPVTPSPEPGTGNKTCLSHAQCNDGIAYTVDWCHNPGPTDSHCHNDTVQCTSLSQCQTNGVAGYVCGKPFGANAPSFCTK